MIPTGVFVLEYRFVIPIRVFVLEYRYEKRTSTRNKLVSEESSDLQLKKEDSDQPNQAGSHSSVL